MENINVIDNAILFFRQLDPTSSGRISHDDFLNAMCASNDTQNLPRDMVANILKDVRYQDKMDGTTGSDTTVTANQRKPMFDYETYCRDVMNTSEKLLTKVKQITVETEHNFEVNSKTYKVLKFEMSRKTMVQLISRKVEP